MSTKNSQHTQDRISKYKQSKYYCEQWKLIKTVNVITDYHNIDNNEVQKRNIEIKEYNLSGIIIVIAIIILIVIICWLANN